MLTYEDFKRINEVHIPSLYSEANKWRCYKNISLVAVLPAITLAGDWAEFGVFRGEFAKMLQGFCAGDPKRLLHLFDAFEGLPEQWSNTGFGKGAFALKPGEIPEFNPKTVRMHRGWFADTLPPFVAAHSSPLAFLHVDCDLYSSTKTVLETCNPLIVPGTVLLFDEFFLPGKDGVSEDECRAFHEWAQAYDRQFQFLWRTRWVQCAIRILR